MATRVNFDNKPQPSTDLEKGAVAKEAMGVEDGNDFHERAPRFHRMSIAAAANGATIEHEHPPKPTKDGNPGFSGHAKPHVITHDHPIMKHVNAIHEAISKDCPDCGK